MEALDPARDPVLVALSDLAEALAQNLKASTVAISRAESIRELRLTGLPYRDIVDETGKPLVVELITENIERLRTSGAALRRAQARALHEEGLTMDQIADLFGVTRQRISAILQQAPS